MVKFGKSQARHNVSNPIEVLPSPTRITRDRKDEINFSHIVLSCYLRIPTNILVLVSYAFQSSCAGFVCFPKFVCWHVKMSSDLICFHRHCKIPVLSVYVSFPRLRPIGIRSTNACALSWLIRVLLFHQLWYFSIHFYSNANAWYYNAMIRLAQPTAADAGRMRTKRRTHPAQTVQKMPRVNPLLVRRWRCTLLLPPSHTMCLCIA